MDHSPPAGNPESVVETIHGIDVADPYRWLEETDDSEVKQWVDDQNDYSAPFLETDRREKLEPQLKSLAEVTTFGDITVRNGTYFRTIEHAGDDHAILYVSDDPERRGDILVDPNEWPANRAENTPPESMSWYVPSWDGTRVAYGVTTGGDEQYDVHVVQTADGEEVAHLESLGRTNPGAFAWDPDDGGFRYLSTGDPVAGNQMDKEVRRFRLDGSDVGIFSHDDRTVWPGLQTDPESGLELVALSEMSGGTDWYVQADGAMRPVLTDMSDTVSITIQDETVFIRTDADAPRGRLLACPIDQFREGYLSLSDCVTIRHEGDAVLQGVVATPDHLVVHEHLHACSRLTVMTHTGESKHPLPVPDHGSVSGLTANRHDEEVFYAVEGINQPETVRRVDPTTGDQTRIFESEVTVPVDLTVEQVFVESSDGAEVPLFLCHRTNLDFNGSTPTLLYGYGGYRHTLTPQFRRFRLPFLVSGGIYAQVCARGGLEYGEEWHESAMFEQKQHTFDDFIAAGEYLCSAGYTDPDHLAVSGASNGGLSVGAVVTQRPDLWGAAVSQVPLLDMLRFHRFLLGESWTAEYGHPDDPEAFEYLSAYSPYHNVESEQSYPPTLFRTATADTRVHPSHAWKMAALLQEEANGGPFLVRTRTDTGHGLGKPTWMIVEEQAETWTFLFEQLDLAVNAVGTTD